MSAPYTDEQVRQFTKAREYPRGRGATDEVSRDILECCHRAGITVTFPEPRYYVDDDGVAPFVVIDRVFGAGVAKFWGREGKGRQYAHEHADRLNAEDDR